MGTPAETLSTYEMNRRTIVSSISSDTDSVSPGTSENLMNAQPVSKLRPSPSPRFTYEGVSTERIRIQSIERCKEEIGLTYDNDALVKCKSRSPQESHFNYLVRASATGLHRAKEETHESPRLSSLRSLHSPSELGSLMLDVAKCPRPSWIRSQSGSIWIQRHRGAHDTDSTTSDRSSADKVVAKSSAGIIIMPLVPPTPPSRAEQNTSRNSSVRVETPFPSTVEGASGAIKAQNTPSVNSLAHRASTQTQKLLSAPVAVFHKLIREKSSTPKSQVAAVRGTSSSSIEVRGHRSGLRRDQTAHILNRVSTLLVETVKAPNLKKGLRAWTGESGSTVSSLNQVEPRQEKPNRGIAATFNIFKNKSLEDLRMAKTATSSILDMQMGSTPQNTPSEMATYKVKRSASQETEEFFKIDISIRGGTSYLPSEARRIHTPPLPEDDQSNGIQRRGFFFDYSCPNLQRDDSSGSQSHSLTSKTSQVTNDKLDPISATKTASGPSSPFRRTGSSHTRPSHSSSQRTNTLKPKQNDWYEAQLADLDALVPDETMNLSQQSSHTRSSDKAKHEQQIRMRDIRRQRFLDQLDWTIPEHLPSSPLCPRHPRY